MSRTERAGRIRERDPESFKARFGKLIRRIRNERGLSQTDVAVKVYGSETKASQVSDVENGRNEPNSNTIAAYCAGLGIDPSLIERLRSGSALNWPEVLSPGIALARRVYGRDEFVAALGRKLDPLGTEAASKTLVLAGSPGVGKTAIAKLLVKTYRHLFRGVWWVHGANRQSTIAGLCDLAQVLGVPELGAGREALAIAALVRLQRESKPWLLIFDNVEQYGILSDFIPETPNIAVVLTSREQNWPEDYVVEPVRPLSAEESARLLMHSSGRDDDRRGADRLAELLDGLPLGLVTAGAWLRDSPSETFDDFAERLGEMIRSKPDAIEDYPESIYGSIMLSANKLSADARLLLRIFAFLAPDDLWPGLLGSLQKYRQYSGDEPYREAFSSVSRELWNLASDTARVERAFANLCRLSLADRQDGDAVGIHRLTQAVMRSDVGAQQAAFQGYALAVVAAAYPSHERNPERADTWSDCLRLARHVDAACLTAPDSPLLEVILKQASRYLDAQADYENALRFTERLLRSRENRLPVDHVEIGGALNDLAIELWRLERLDEAEHAAQRAARMALGSESVPIDRRAIWLSIHGVVLNHQALKLHGEERRRKLSLARRRFLYALALSLKVNKRNSRVIGMRLYNLAGVRADQGHFRAALRLHGAALRIKRSCVDTSDPELAFGLLGLGMVLLELGYVLRPYKGDSALRLITRSLEIREHAFPGVPTHPDIRKSARWLAITLRTLVELDDPSADLKRMEELMQKYQLDGAEIRQKSLEYAQRARAQARASAD